MRVEHLSGNQLHYECRCPHCEVFTEPSFKQIRFNHCRFETLAGMPKQWDKPRILTDFFWECPHCQ